MKMKKKYIKKLIVKEPMNVEPITDLNKLNYGPDAPRYWIYVKTIHGPVYFFKNGDEMRKDHGLLGNKIQKWYAYPGDAAGSAAMKKRKEEDFPPQEYTDEDYGEE